MWRTGQDVDQHFRAVTKLGGEVSTIKLFLKLQQQQLVATSH
jgi:hypothetical protein